MSRKKKDSRLERLEAVANGDYSNNVAVIEFFCMKIATIEERLKVIEKRLEKPEIGVSGSILAEEE